MDPILVQFAGPERWLPDGARPLRYADDPGAPRVEGDASGAGADGSAGAMLELSCETDFVARNEDFQRAVVGSGRTIMAMTASTPIGTPTPERRTLPRFSAEAGVDMD